MADRQQYRMLRVHRTDVIFHLVRSKQVLSAQFLIRIHMLNADRSEDAAKTAHPSFFQPTRYRLHTLQHAPLPVSSRDVVNSPQFIDLPHLQS